MKHRRTPAIRFPLDALVDIVSNNVGILMILAAFVAVLLVLFPGWPGSPVAENDDTRAGELTRAKELSVTVPWTRATSKSSLFAFLGAGRIKVLDLDPLYTELQKRPALRRPQPLDLRWPDMAVRFYPVTNEVYCIQFRPEAGAGETWAEAGKPGSDWQRSRERLKGERFTTFFWVASDSFGAFRTLRDTLRQEGLEVGWKPVRRDAPLELCQGVDGGSGLDPQ